MSQALATLLVSLFIGTAAAQPGGNQSCVGNQGFLAEGIVDHLDSWKKVHHAFKDFSKCDDGGVAEGLSEAVVHLLAHDWQHVSELQRLIHVDQNFEGFVLKHIDATTDDSDLRTIERLSASKCPMHGEALCAKVNAASKKAISEL